MQRLSITVTADLVGIEHRANPLVEDDHVGGFDRDVGSATEGDADFGSGQRAVEGVERQILLRIEDEIYTAVPRRDVRRLVTPAACMC